MLEGVLVPEGVRPRTLTFAHPMLEDEALFRYISADILDFLLTRQSRYRFALNTTHRITDPSRELWKNENGVTS